MTKVLAILSQKGGVGKTTLATCLAVAAEAAGKRTVIIDLDPQATASFWKDVRIDDRPAVETVQPIRLTGYLASLAKQGVQLVILDGPAVAQDITLMAARDSDFVLIPAKPAVFDTMSMTHTLDVVRGQSRRHAVVLTFTTPQGQEASDAAELIGQLGAEIAPVTIGNRKAFFRAQGAGLAVQEFEPQGQAAQEIAALYLYTDKQLNTRKKETAQ